MQTQALVLRSAASRENDRLVTALTEGCGIIKAFANGARKPKSPMHAATQPFCYGRMEYTQRPFQRGGDTYTITEARPEGVFFEGLAADISRLALANYCAALCVELAPRQEEAPAQLRLMLNALHFLSTGTRPQHLIKSVVELRLITLAGYMPGEGSGIRGQEAGDAVMAAVEHICAAPLERAFRFALPEDALRALSRVSQAYVQRQTGRNFPELGYWEGLE